ncbi:MAG: endonuclease/exonuclease/phosphatase family protein [Acidimicrobiaceae bacterium]|nr:endonuclease/exonuclease/phosphatase family protein [Acidimicrobiaceae bacterium]
MPPSRRPTATWRVVTWNLWWRFGPDPEGRFPGIEKVLQSLDADIICLQEVYSDRTGTNDAERLGSALGLHAVCTAHDPGAEHSLGNAVLSRWPVTQRGERALPDAGSAAGHRRALWAVLSAPFGPLPVISTHLAYRFDESAVRQQQIREVAALAAALRQETPDAPPVVLCGDLNAVPDSDELRLMTGRSPVPVPGLVFNDCWPQVRDDPGHTWVKRNPHLIDSVWPERRLDYVMVSWPRLAPLGNPVQAFLVGDGPVDGVWPSDHLGVAVDLRHRGAE